MVDDRTREAILERVKRIPIGETLRFEFDGFEEGVCRARMPRDRRYDGVFESLHGGILLTFADSIACFALMTLTGPDEVMATTDMSIRFLAPCLTGVRGEARVVKCGKTLSPIRVELFDEGDRLVAVADVTYIRLSKMPVRGEG